MTREEREELLATADLLTTDDHPLVRQLAVGTIILTRDYDTLVDLIAALHFKASD